MESGFNSAVKNYWNDVTEQSRLEPPWPWEKRQSRNNYNTWYYFNTVTGATSGTTGVITALGTNQITVNTVDGFFKKGEVVSANDVSTLTISSFS